MESDLLALISKVGVTLLASETLNEILDQVVSLTFEAVPGDRCVIMLRKADSDEMSVSVARGRDRGLHIGDVRISRNLLDEVLRGKSILTSGRELASRFITADDHVHSVLAVPLGVGDNVFGILFVDSPEARGRFSEDHLKVLTKLASVAAIRVENARIIEAQRELESLNRERQLASEIRERYQPKSPPQIVGYDCQGITFPCREVGGDYYYFFPRDDGHLLITVGEVAGKGTAAALMISSLHAAIHANASSHQWLIDMISALNHQFVDNIPRNSSIALFCADLIPDSGALSFLNAGFNPPFLIHSDNGVECLEPCGNPIGLDPRATYREGDTQLNYGDVLVISSTGVTEAQSPSGEEFGPARLHEVVSRNINASAAGIRDKIESALTNFCQGQPALNDMTLIILKRLNQG